MEDSVGIYASNKLEGTQNLKQMGKEHVYSNWSTRMICRIKSRRLIHAMAETLAMLRMVENTTQEGWGDWYEGVS
jgi:hypothetical protein